MVAMLVKSAGDGWLPKIFTKSNKFGRNVYAIGLMYIPQIILILFDVPLNTLMFALMLSASFCNLLVALGFFGLTKKHPELFKNKSAVTRFRVIAVLSMCSAVVLFYFSANGVSAIFVAINIVVIVALYLISYLMKKSGRVEIKNNFRVEMDTESGSGEQA